VSTASQLAHEGLPIQSPHPLAALDEGIDRLALAPSDRVLDVGSGTGELLRRVVERWPGTTGVGVDLLTAEPVHPAVELRAADASTVLGERFAAVCCVGSIHALGGGLDGYRALAELAPVALVGDGYWRHEPDPRYLDALGATADELPDRAGLRSVAAAAGWREAWSVQATVADLTAYEEALLANADRHLDREDVVAYATAIRAWRAAPGGTDTLGFALTLLQRT
jgi:SAM-dependent methyltransferase